MIRLKMKMLSSVIFVINKPGTKIFETISEIVLKYINEKTKKNALQSLRSSAMLKTRI